MGSAVWITSPNSDNPDGLNHELVVSSERNYCNRLREAQEEAAVANGVWRPTIEDLADRFGDAHDDPDHPQRDYYAQELCHMLDGYFGDLQSLTSSLIPADSQRIVLSVLRYSEDAWHGDPASGWYRPYAKERTEGWIGYHEQFPANPYLALSSVFPLCDQVTGAWLERLDEGYEFEEIEGWMRDQRLEDGALLLEQGDGWVDATLGHGGASAESGFELGVTFERCALSRSRWVDVFQAQPNPTPPPR